MTATRRRQKRAWYMSEEAKEVKRIPPMPEELFGHESHIHTARAVLHMLQHMVYQLEKEKGWYDTHGLHGG